MDLIKAIKSAKDVFLDVPLNSTSIWIKVNKKELLGRLAVATSKPIENELEIVSQYGKSAIYLGRKL